jgi:hypothetical protein
MVDETRNRLQAFAERVKAATVAVGLQHPPEGPKKRPFTSIGTGFCIHNQGVIATSRHVMEEFIDPVNALPVVILYHPRSFAGKPAIYFHIRPVRESRVLKNPAPRKPSIWRC